MDSHNIEAVKQWPRPTSAIDIRSFIGLAGYYTRLLEGFSFIASSLTRLTQKMVLTRLTEKMLNFKWSDDYEKSFTKLKTRLTTTRVLNLLEV